MSQLTVIQCLQWSGLSHEYRHQWFTAPEAPENLAEESFSEDTIPIFPRMLVSSKEEPVLQYPAPKSYGLSGLHWAVFLRWQEG